jgi:hypothetical protein
VVVSVMAAGVVMVSVVVSPDAAILRARTPRSLCGNEANRAEQPGSDGKGDRGQRMHGVILSFGAPANAAFKERIAAAAGDTTEWAAASGVPAFCRLEGTGARPCSCC